MIALLGFLLIFQQSFIPPDYQQLQQGIGKIYSVQFDSATAIFDSYLKKHPNRPEGYFFYAMVKWWQIILDIENPLLDEPFLSAMDDVIEKCDRLIDDNTIPDVALYYKGGCLGFKARLLGNRKQWISAANNGRKAYPIVSAALDGDFKFVDAKFGIGIYKYYAEIIPDKYPILKPLLYFFPEGNKKEGIQALLDVKENGLFAKDEATYFLISIYNNYENNSSEAYKLSGELVRKYPNNPFFQLSYASAQITNGYPEQANINLLTYLSNIEKSVPYYQSYQKTQVYYALGLSQYYVGKNDNALLYFDKSIQYYRSSSKNSQTNYYIESLLHSAELLKKMGQNKEADKRYQLVLTLPNNGSTHQRAQKGISTQ